MSPRIVSLVIGAPALVAGMLVSVLLAGSAQAASAHVSVSTPSVAISGSGNGKVFATCHGNASCKGTIYFAGDDRVPTAYSLKAHQTAWISLKVKSSDPQSPFHDDGGTGGALHARTATLRINETSPSKIYHDKSINAERVLATQTITGTVTGAGPAPTDLKVTLVPSVANTGTLNTLTRNVSVGGTYSFPVKLGTNNVPSAKYFLQISGEDSDGDGREWYWRGTDGTSWGGGRYLREASVVQATKANPFKADFTYTSLTGKVTRSDGTGISGASVTASAVPVNFPTAATDLRELDVQSCVNVYGHDTTTSTGSYTIGFLPVKQSADDPRYFLTTTTTAKDPDGVALPTTWTGATTAYGSCWAATGYSSHTVSHAIALNKTTATTKNVVMENSSASIQANAAYSGYSPTSLNDRWVTLRSYIPGATVLSSPIYASGTASSTGVKNFYHVPAGYYWLEYGRRTGCTDWVKSRYPNNSAYFQGLDRGVEKWKAFTHLSALPGNATSGLELIARQHGATWSQQEHTPTSPYHGWMYREYCAANSAGYVSRVYVNTSGVVSKAPTIKKGATVKGHVSRPGHTNKEILVSLVSTQGTLVQRTAITDGSGNFTIKGVASGNYKVEINSDSWRGIGRTFTGTHFKRVSAGHAYSVGTLTFKG